MPMTAFVNVVLALGARLLPTALHQANIKKSTITGELGKQQRRFERRLDPFSGKSMLVNTQHHANTSTRLRN